MSAAQGVRAATSLPWSGRNETELDSRAWRLLNLASIDAVRGDENRCRALTAEAGTLAAQISSPALEMGADHVLGLLELSLGNLAVAGWQFSRCVTRAQACRLADPCVLRFEPDLVEALLALGHRRQAVWAALTLGIRAERFGSDWARSMVARCSGLLADDASFAQAFDTALGFQSSLNPIDRARTQLLFGERLRRARRRADARLHLAAALATFSDLGAAPWIERANRELEATTITARTRNDPSRADDLTPQEQSVVRMIAAGATVREAAGRLFLSPKTIEAHLGRAYRKLGVHNRAQLVMTVTRTLNTAGTLAACRPAEPPVGSRRSGEGSIQSFPLHR